jgi:hypothetical protein
MFLKVDKPDSNLFQSQWLFYFMKMFYSAEKQMLSAMSLVIEQRKNEFDRIAKVWFSPI